MRTVIITGANSGLGRKTAEKIARNKEYRIILACRNKAKGNQSKHEIIMSTGNMNIFSMALDTSSLASVRQFAKDYENSGYGKAYALLCNAGINGFQKGLTEDGIDIVFETNHLGHFLLTHLMMHQMEESGKIFVTSSDMHDSPMEKMKWKGTEALAHPSGSFAKAMSRYSYSKLCNLYFVYELARRLAAENCEIRVNAFNPGFMQTNFMSVNKAQLAFVKYTMPKRFGDLEKSSDALAELTVNDKLASLSAQYFDRSIHTCRSSELSYNEENAFELWEKSMELCSLTE